MPPYLPIRALNRSAAIRINSQRILPGVTSYIDLGAAGVPKELAYHSAIGQVFVVGSLSGNASNTDVVSGGVTSAGTGLSVNVTAGEIRNATTGAYVAGLAGSNVATANTTSAGQSMMYLVVWDNTSGVVTTIAGVPATTGTEVAPALPATKTALATVDFAFGAVAPTTIVDVRPRP